MSATGGKGIRCPGCGCGHFRTTRTRPATGGRVMRIRACRHCDRQVITYEAAAGLSPDPSDLSPEQRETFLQKLFALVGVR